MIWVIRSCIWALECVSTMMCIHTANGTKFPYNRKVVLLVLLNTLLFGMVHMKIIPAIAVYVIMYGSFWFYAYYEFRKRILETTLRYLGGVLLIFVIELGAILIASFFKAIINSKELLELLASMITFAIASLIDILFLTSNIKLYYSKNDKIINVVHFICITICGLFVIDFAIFHIIDYSISFIVIFLIVLLYVYLSVLKKRRWELETHNLEMKMNEIYAATYEELIKEVRRKQHDYKNQLATIYGMQFSTFDEKKIIEQQKCYASDLEEKFKYEHLLTCCNNKSLAGFLYYKCLSFEKEGVDVDFNVNVNQAKTSMYLHEMIEILGILMDNAFEYLKSHRQHEPCIGLKVLEEGNHMLLEVKNQTEFLRSSQIEAMFQEGYSTKGDNRGIGLFRVKQLIDKYGATLIVANQEIDGDNFLIFQIQIK